MTIVCINCSHWVIVALFLRNLASNQLSGTIPPQLGSLTNLTWLYTQNHIAPHWHCVLSPIWHITYIISNLTLFYKIWFDPFVIYTMWISCIFHCSHCFIVALSDRSLNQNHLTDTIPPQLGSLTQLEGLYAQNRIPCIDTAYYHRFDIICSWI